MAKRKLTPIEEKYLRKFNEMKADHLALMNLCETEEEGRDVLNKFHEAWAELERDQRREEQEEARIQNEWEAREREKDRVFYAKLKEEHEAFLKRLEAMPIPPPFIDTIPLEKKFEHTWILAGSGGGKTTLIYREILENLKRPDPPAIVVIDPKGTMLDTLSRFRVFHPDNDRLVIIDPTDLDAAPALNLFHPGDFKRFRMYSESVREQVIGQTVSLLAYAFDTQSNALTPQQLTAFSYSCRLMLSLVQVPTIHDLLSLLNDKAKTLPDSKWYPHIMRLNATSQSYFANQFFEQRATREGVATRIHGILSDARMDKIFGARERTIDMFPLLQERKTIFFHTPIGVLGESGKLFGKYAIAMTLSAALERIGIPKERWTPTLLFIDEIQDLADDERIPSLFRTARQFNLGIYAANQDIDALPQKLKSAMSASTATKFISSLGGMDLNFMVREMRVDADRLAAVQRTDTHARYLCYCRGITTQGPLNVQFPFSDVYDQPKLTDDEHHLLMEMNRNRVAAPLEIHEAPTVEVTPIPVTQPVETPQAPSMWPDDPDKPGKTW